MRNRLTVMRESGQTTARFPACLWRLALIATGLKDHELAKQAHEHFRNVHAVQPDKRPTDVITEWLGSLIEAELTLVGFNPDSSRAHVPGKAPKAPAAEARPSFGNH